ncbi:MAG: metallophosphoesterase, partial [Candidatus Marinimicrobia bacterium]|nr:metallophosphoesterase [Candidatus Neomarinimicrobiota bacterium]
IFFAIVLTILFFINYYIYWHGLKAIGQNPTIRLIYTIIFVGLASAYFLGRIVERFSNGIMVRFLEWMGAYWLGAMVYFLLIVIAIDLFRLINHYVPLIPAGLRQNLQQLKIAVGIAAIIVVSIVLIIGRWNATHPQIKNLEIDIHKKANAKAITIAFASDIHLGSLVGQRQLKQLVEIIEVKQPDLILFGGDLLDEDLLPVIRRNLGQCLEELRAPLGKFTVTGNHEFIGGVDNAVQYLENHGITVLRDSSIQLSNGIWILGRDDRDGKRFSGGESRQALNELISEVNSKQPLILLDHQPVNLSESIVNGIDLQLSGHTHHGQLWPLNYITSKLFQISRGYKLIEKTHFLVSSGFGTWGPPIRLASRSEIYFIKVNFISD